MGLVDPVVAIIPYLHKSHLFQNNGTIKEIFQTKENPTNWLLMKMESMVLTPQAKECQAGPGARVGWTPPHQARSRWSGFHTHIHSLWLPPRRISFYSKKIMCFKFCDNLDYSYKYYNIHNILSNYPHKKTNVFPSLYAVSSDYPDQYTRSVKTSLASESRLKYKALPHGHQN